MDEKIFETLTITGMFPANYNLFLYAYTNKEPIFICWHNDKFKSLNRNKLEDNSSFENIISFLLTINYFNEETDKCIDKINNIDLNDNSGNIITIGTCLISTNLKYALKAEVCISLKEKKVYFNTKDAGEYQNKFGSHIILPDFNRDRKIEEENAIKKMKELEKEYDKQQNTMIRVKIGYGMDLTLLYKAYSENLLPLAENGEILYDHDQQNQINFLYFISHSYFKSLLEYIANNKFKFLNSNAANEWEHLFQTLSNSNIVDKSEIDFGFLDHYTMVIENFDEKEIDLSIIENEFKSDSTFYRDMKRLYKGYNVSYWGSERNVVIHLPFNHELEFKFNLKPIIGLLNKHNIDLKEFNVYRDYKRNLTVVQIEIK